MASKGWKVVQAHIPLIKFRKGGHHRTSDSVSAAASRTVPSTTKSTGATGPGVTVLPTIDHYQLPLRYQRRPIDEKEIAYINRGGPE